MYNNFSDTWKWDGALAKDGGVTERRKLHLLDKLGVSDILKHICQFIYGTYEQ